LKSSGRLFLYGVLFLYEAVFDMKRPEFNEIFEAAVPNDARSDMRTEWKHPRIAWAARLLAEELKKLPARRRVEVAAQHLEYFNVPTRVMRSRRSS
jgi:hypothetical protein